LFLGIAIFANLANCWRLLELTRIDMLIMSYGGLRGAIAFALALILDETKIPRKKEFLTATIAVVFFTVFVQVKSSFFSKRKSFFIFICRVLRLVHL
jgi:NhaP-type Na+/H+ or K+/H+ antiporter